MYTDHKLYGFDPFNMHTAAGLTVILVELHDNLLHIVKSLSIGLHLPDGYLLLAMVEMEVNSVVNVIIR